jgi:Protein of unknown function (DUF2490)
MKPPGNRGGPGLRAIARWGPSSRSPTYLRTGRTSRLTTVDVYSLNRAERFREEVVQTMACRVGLPTSGFTVRRTLSFQPTERIITARVTFVDFGCRCLKLVVIVSAFLLVSAPTEAQTFQFWPEISTYLKLNSDVRLYFIATTTRENGKGSSGEIGPNVDLYFKPLVKLERATVFQLDKSKSRPLLLRLGYRYLPSTDGPTEHRAVVEATGRYPLKSGFLVSDRNRADLRFINGEFSWRYRNRLTVERTVSLWSYHFSPYIRGEVYYDSNYQKFSRTAGIVGAAFPIRRHTEIETYYEHQNDTGQSPNRQVNALGLALNLYF